LQRGLPAAEIGEIELLLRTARRLMIDSARLGIASSIFSHPFYRFNSPPWMIAECYSAHTLRISMLINPTARAGLDSASHNRSNHPYHLTPGGAKTQFVA
jgi:hypothetical protein